MKLAHLSEIRTAAKPQTQPKRNPFSSFNLAAGSLALLSVFAFGRMASPPAAAAEDAKPLAATPAPESTKAVQVPASTQVASPQTAPAASDTLKPAQGIAKLQPAKPVVATPAYKSPAISDFSLVRVTAPIGYRTNPIRDMRNVPLEIRAVEGYPPIAASTVSFPADVDLEIFGLDVNVGPAFSFDRDRFAVQVGAGAELFNIMFTDKKKGPSIDITSTDYYWTWYDVAPSIRLGPSLSVNPYILAEVKARINDMYAVGLGCRLSNEDFVARNGTDGRTGYGNPLGVMTERQTFNLVDMTVGMPYVLFGIYPAFMQDGNAPNTLVKGRCVYLYFGFKHIISEKLSDLARQGDLDYSNFAWSLGIGVTGSKF